MKNKAALVWVFVFCACLIGFGACGAALAEEAFSIRALDDDSCAVQSYNGNQENLVVPSSIQGLTVRRIDDDAFSGKADLRSVTLPNTVTEIGNNAFYQCSGLEAVELGTGLVSIGQVAFYGCATLEEIEFPASLRSIGRLAFSHCSALESVAIPYGVQSIEDNTFESCTALRTVDLADSVTQIGNSAFHGCNALADVDLGSGVKTIGAWAFNECKALTYIAFPDGLTNVGGAAFSGTPLRKILLPDSVTQLGEQPFDVSFAKEVRWSAGLESVPGSFFRDGALEKIEIPEGVESIGDWAFRGCQHLVDVSLPDTLTAVPDGCFWGCGALEEIRLPANATAIGASAFQDCTSLTSVAIPNSVTQIGDYAFDNCTALTGAQLGTGVKSLGMSAFYGCSALKSIELPDSLTGMGTHVFEGCSSLKSAVLSEELQAIPVNAFVNCKQLASIVIPDSVTRIESSAFNGCSALTRVDMGSGVETIEGWVFNGCGQLTDVNFPDGLTSVGYTAFLGAPLPKIILPDSVTQLDESAFDISFVKEFRWSAGLGAIPDSYFRNSPLEEIVIPEGVSSIGASAFRNCQSLVSVTLPGTLTEISENSFRDCGALATIRLPANLAVIGKSAFEECRSLKSVAIPNAVTGIGDSAFYDCTALTSVQFGTGLETIGDGAFCSCTALKSVRLPNGLLSLGGGAFESCSSLESAILPEGLTSIPDNAFCSCNSLKGIVIPDSVTKIEYNAFYYCTSMTSADLGSGLRTLEDWAFIGCRSLKELRLPDALASIGAYAFQECDALETIELPDGLERIGDCAFDSCDSLASVVIPASTGEIGGNAFAYCGKLTARVFRGTYAEQYVIGNRVRFAYELSSHNSLKVALHTAGPIQNYAGSKLRLYVDGAEKAVITLMGQRESYEFTILEPGEDYAVRLFSARGDELAAAEHIPVTLTDSLQKKKNLCELDVSVVMAGATVRVVDPEGQDVTDRVSVRWYENGELIHTGSQLPCQPVGKAFRVQAALSQSMGVVYAEPQARQITIAGDGPETVIALNALPRVTVAGRALSAADDSPLQGVTLSVSQTVNGRFAYYTQAKTNASGEYAFEVIDAPYALTAYKSGYVDYQGAPVDHTIRMEPLMSQYVALDIAYSARSEAGPEAAEIDAGDLLVRASDPASGARRQAELLYPRLMLPQCEAGDRVRLTLSSASGAFAPAEVVLTLQADSENNRASVSLTQYGGVHVVAPENPNAKTLFALYDSQGKYVSSSVTGDDGASFADLPDGDYTALIMGAHSRFRAVAALDMMADMGYAEDADYICLPVRVNAGTLSVATASRAVPPLDGDQLSWIDYGYVSTNRQSLVIGNYVTVRASAVLVDEAAAAGDFAWLVSVPANNQYVGGTAMLGNAAAACAVNGDGMLEIPADSPDDKLRLCFVPTAEGECEVNAFLRFTLGGKTYLQPVGAATYQAKGLTVNAPFSVDSGDVFIRGTASSHAMVYLYCDDALIGQSRANANGSWSMAATLPTGSYTAYYPVHVEAQSAADPSLVLVSPDQFIRYSPGSIVLESVTMINTAHPADSADPCEFETVFDYTGRQNALSYYRYWPAYPDFTFVVRFNHNDPERISTVRMSVKLSDGSVRTLNAVYSADYDGWVATDRFADSFALPVQVGVMFARDMEFISEPITWDMEVSDTQVTQQTSADGNETTYIVQSDDGTELLRKTVRFETLSRAAWEALNADGQYARYDADGDAVYYTRTVEDDRTSTSEAVMVKGDTATLVRETTDSELFEMYKGYTGILAEPEFQAIMDASALIQVERTGPGGLALPDNMPLRSLSDSEAIGDSGHGCKCGKDCSCSANLNYPSYYDSSYKDMCDKVDEAREFLDDFDKGPLFGLIDEAAEAFDGVKEIADMLKEGKPDFGLSKDSVIDIIEGGALMGALIQDINRSNLSFDQKLVLNMNAGAALVANAATSLAEGMISFTAKAASGLVILNNGVIDGYLKVRLKLSHDDAEIDRLLDRLNENRDAYQEKMDNYDRYVDQTLNNMKHFSRWAGDKLYDKMWSLQNQCQCAGPDPDSDTKGVEMDPSGIVYEAIPGNVLEGVKATLIQQVTEYDIYGDPHTYEQEWNAEDYEQINPQLTNADGYYGWDVPDGLWRVRYEKDGYETAYSEWMEVPPPRFDVNVGLVSFDAPAVRQARVYGDRVEITFTRYMKTASLGDNMALVTVNGIATDGEWAWPDAQVNPLNAEEQLGLRLVFYPQEAIPADAEVGVELSRQLSSYADVAMQEPYSRTFSVIPDVESLNAPEEVALEYAETLAVEIQAAPTGLSAGLRVTLSSASPHVVEAAEESVVLDEQGRATVHLIGKGPGSTQCLLKLDGTEISASIKATVGMPEAVVLKVQNPVASAADGAALPYGTEIALTSGTPNASIYYFLEYADGSATERAPYTAPFALYGDATLYVTAQKASMTDSDVVVYHYSVYRAPAEERRATYPWTDWCSAYSAGSLPGMEDIAVEGAQWISSDPGVAEVQNGALVVKQPGEAQVIAVNGRDTLIAYAVRVESVAAGFALPGGLQEIESQAFYGLTSLRSVSIPESVRSIGDEAFRYCGRLRLVYVPESVRSIGANAFAACHSSLFILGRAGSCAESYAAAAGIPFLALQQ